MFSILLGFFNTSTQDYLEDFCQTCGEFSIHHASTKDEWYSLFKQHEFDCFFFDFDQNEAIVRDTICTLRNTDQHQHTPILLFSTKIEYLITAFVHWRCCECFLLPFANETKEALSSLLYHYAGLHEKIHLVPHNFFQIDTPKGLHNLPHNDILYIESTMKKSIIHLKNDVIHVPQPLYQVKSLVPDKNFIQIHRSFIVNLNNISHVDKSTEPWSVHFFHSKKEAFVSRSHKKTLPSFFH
ncbi:MAG: LytR/AlgR family response regulator transcription factor [Anaerotignum sp.]